MARMKHPFQRTQFSKENLISSSNPAHTTHRTPKKLPPNKSYILIEMTSERNRITCLRCRVSEHLIKIPPHYYQPGDRTHVANEQLREAIGKFKANHDHK